MTEAEQECRLCKKEKNHPKHILEERRKGKEVERNDKRRREKLKYTRGNNHKKKRRGERNE